MSTMYYLGMVLSVNTVMALAKKSAGVKPLTADNTINFVHSILAQFSLVIGIGFVLLSLYKYTEHRQNPLANPLGKVISMLLTGAAMIGLYFIPMPGA